MYARGFDDTPRHPDAGGSLQLRDGDEIFGLCGDGGGVPSAATVTVVEHGEGTDMWLRFHLTSLDFDFRETV